MALAAGNTSPYSPIPRPPKRSHKAKGKAVESAESEPEEDHRARPTTSSGASGKSGKTSESVSYMQESVCILTLNISASCRKFENFKQSWKIRSEKFGSSANSERSISDIPERQSQRNLSSEPET